MCTTCAEGSTLALTPAATTISQAAKITLELRRLSLFLLEFIVGSRCAENRSIGHVVDVAFGRGAGVAGRLEGFGRGWDARIGMALGIAVVGAAHEGDAGAEHEARNCHGDAMQVVHGEAPGWSAVSALSASPGACVL